MSETLAQLRKNAAREIGLPEEYASVLEGDSADAINADARRLVHESGMDAFMRRAIEGDTDLLAKFGIGKEANE